MRKSFYFSAAAFFLLSTIILPRVLQAQTDITSEDVSFSSQDLTLAGSVYLPEGCTSCPAMVFLGGGSARTRNNQIPFAERFARKGIAALVYDKRGAGGSTGNYDSISFEDLVTDATAAVHYLSTRPEINANLIGLWGGSEGGTMALIVASRTDQVAYTINLAGPVNLFRESQLYSFNQAMKADGVEDAARKQVHDLWTTYFEEAEAGTISASTMKRIQNWPTTTRSFIPPERADFPPEDGATGRSFWHLNKLEVMPRLNAPVLMAFGELDQRVPAAANIELIEHIIQTYGKANIEHYTFPKASHAFVTPEGVLVTDFFEVQINWALKQIEALKQKQ